MANCDPNTVLSGSPFAGLTTHELQAIIAQLLCDISTGGGGGGGVSVSDEGVQVVATASNLNFVGDGVTASDGGGGVATITIPGGGSGGLSWTVVTAATEAMAVNNGYIENRATLVTLTLPATAAVGDVIRVTGIGAGGWSIAQNAGQTIHFGAVDTTTGAGGSLSSTDERDSVEMICVVADTDWNVLSAVGNLTLV